MQNQAEEDELGLSIEALAALKEFAFENNLLPVHEAVDADVRLQVQESLDVKEKDHEFRFTYGGDDDTTDEQVSVLLTGVNPELGQTLASTGLTVWRAAEELARFMWEHRRWFVGKNVVELGAGLGLCSVLASRLCIGGKVVVTDGGDEFTDSAMDALRRNLEKNSCLLEVPSGQHVGLEDDSLPGERTSMHGDPSTGARVVLERLTWGEHEDFLERYGDAARLRGGFDFIVAADVLYEEEAVIPLLRTVVDILRLRHDPGAALRQKQVNADSKKIEQEAQTDQESRSVPFRESGDGRGVGDLVEELAADGTQTGEGVGDVSSPRRCSASGLPSVPTFLLSFARRNVSIDRVLQEAEGLGLWWTVPDDFVPISASENVYLMCLDNGHKTF